MVVIKAFLKFLMNFPCYLDFFLMNEKSEIRSILPCFCKMVRTQVQTSIQNIHSDICGEFMCLEDFFHEIVIYHQTTILNNN